MHLSVKTILIDQIKMKELSFYGGQKSLNVVVHDFTLLPNDSKTLTRVDKQELTILDHFRSC